jgi:hypothetical protein
MASHVIIADTRQRRIQSRSRPCGHAEDPVLTLALIGRGETLFHRRVASAPNTAQLAQRQRVQQD